MKKIIVWIFACILLSACSVDSKKEEIQPSLISEEESSEEAENETIEKMEEIPVMKDISVEVMNKEDDITIEAAEVTTETLESSYRGIDNNVVSHVKIDYPILQNDMDEEGIQKINEFFQESANAWYEENNTYATDHVIEVKEESQAQEAIESDYLNEYTVTFEVKYNDNGILSILQNFNEQYAKKEANSYSTGYLFDLNTGERLTIADVLQGTDDDIAQIIGQAFMASDLIEEQVKKNNQEEILSNTQYAEFYIDSENIVFFYNSNMVLPYEEGMISANLSLETQGVFKLQLK